MSLPARALAPRTTGRGAPAPGRPVDRRAGHARARTTAEREAVRTRETPRARPVRHHIGFVVFATVVLGGLVIGLVALNASLAQTSFRIGDLDAKLAALTDRNAVLTRRVADRSAPGRIADWAARHGMRLPDEIHFLLVPEHAAGRIDPAGERTRPTGGAP